MKIVTRNLRGDRSIIKASNNKIAIITTTIIKTISTTTIILQMSSQYKRNTPPKKRANHAKPISDSTINLIKIINPITQSYYKTI